MDISIEVIKNFRAQTGAGITEAKKVLEETNGDTEKAIKLLRERGKKVMESKAARATKEGVVASYTHATGKIGSMVMLVCETDFVSRGDVFKTLGYNIAMHVAASSPRYVSRTDVPADVLNNEKEVAANQLKSEGKNEAMIEKILPGKLDKFYQEYVLLDQPYIREETKTIANLLEEATQQLGEHIEIKQFVRMSIE